MRNTSPTHLVCKLLPLAATCLLTASGCGDAGMFPLRNDAASDAGLIASLHPNDVTTRYDASECGQETCNKSREPAVEVHVEAQGLILDFSNVEAPGQFADTDFAGYVVEVVPDAGMPILAARVDTGATTLDIGDDRVAYDESGIEINLAGLAYDSTTFIKIDVWAGQLNPLRAGR